MAESSKLSENKDDKLVAGKPHLLELNNDSKFNEEKDRQVKRMEMKVDGIKEIREADHISFLNIVGRRNEAIVEDINYKTGEINVFERVADEVIQKTYNFSTFMCINRYEYENNIELDKKSVIKLARKLLENNNLIDIRKNSDFPVFCKTGFNQSLGVNISLSCGIWDTAKNVLLDMVEAFSKENLCEWVVKVISFEYGYVAPQELVFNEIHELYGLIRELREECLDEEVFKEKMIVLCSRRICRASFAAITLAVMFATPVPINSKYLATVFITISGLVGYQCGVSFGNLIDMVRRNWSQILEYFAKKLRQFKEKVKKIIKDALYDFLCWYMENSKFFIKLYSSYHSITSSYTKHLTIFGFIGVLSLM